MKNVVFILPKETQRQLAGLINYFLKSNCNLHSEIGQYLLRLTKVIQTIDEYYNVNANDNNFRFKQINRSPYGRDDHSTRFDVTKPFETGFLKKGNGKYISRNIDKSNRLVAFELDKGVIGIVYILGHYHDNLFNQKDFEILGNELEYQYNYKRKLFSKLQQSSDLLIKTLVSITPFQNINSDHFNKKCRSLIFPLDFKDVNDTYYRSRNSINTHLVNNNTKSIYTIKKQREVLDELDNQIFRVLKNNIDLSYFISSSYGNKQKQLSNLIKPNYDSITDYKNIIKLFNNEKDVFATPSQIIDKTLHACSTAFAESFKFEITNELISDFASRFKKEIDYDIELIKIIENNRNLSSKDLNFENTTTFLEEYYEQIIQTNSQSNNNQNNINHTDNKSYFYIPFADREDAKKIGAKWDFDIRCWYVPSGIDLSPFTAQGWRKLTDKEVNEAREQKRAINAKNSSMTDQQQQNISNFNVNRKDQETITCKVIAVYINPNDFKGLEALGAFYDKERDKWLVPAEPETLNAVSKYLSKEETDKRRANEAKPYLESQKKVNQQEQTKNKKKGR